MSKHNKADRVEYNHDERNLNVVEYKTDHGEQVSGGFDDDELAKVKAEMRKMVL